MSKQKLSSFDNEIGRQKNINEVQTFKKGNLCRDFLPFWKMKKQTGATAYNYSRKCRNRVLIA